MTTLVQLVEILAGGPGSGCHGPNCGRPHTKEETEALKKELKEARERLATKRGKVGYVRKKDKPRVKILREGLKRQIQYGKRREKGAPGLKWQKGKITIPVKPAWKGRVKQTFKTTEGHQVTIVKPAQEPKQQEQKSWLKKPSEFKGQFTKTHDEFNATGKLERNVLFQAIQGEKGQAVQVSRNFGDKHVYVKEVALLSRPNSPDNILRTRQVTFKNLAQALGFLKGRYGIKMRMQENRR